MSVGRATLALVCALATACAAPRPQPPPGPLVATEPPPLDDDLDPASLREAIERTRGAAPEPAAVADRLLAIVEGVPDPAARAAAVGRAFRVVRIGDPLVLTAYYEPELPARRTPDATYRHPLYARPPDLIDFDPAAFDASCACRRLAGRLVGGTLRPYASRAEIDAGALAGRGLELAWIPDPIAVFVLHVQGSGRLRFDDGSVRGVRYAGTNGRAYRSIAPALVSRGLLPAGPTTWPDMRRALDTLAPEERAAVLATNERYTFFRLADGGPVGSLGVELTPGRSVATDPRVVVPGAVAYLATPTVRRFVVSQDTGAAITGARADLFLGTGSEAEARAGVLNERGALYLFLPR